MSDNNIKTVDLNRSFRLADIKRWQSLDFVVGYEIRRSNNPLPGCEICDRLAGKYPKSFIWTGWHDGCKCHCVSILNDDEELRENRVSRLKAAINGTKPIKIKSKNQIDLLPTAFMIWYEENKSSWNESNTPDFIEHNIDLINKLRQ